MSSAALVDPYRTPSLVDPHRRYRARLVVAGEPVVLLERPTPEWTVARAMQAMQQRSADRAAAAALLEVPALSDAWRKTLSH